MNGRQPADTYVAALLAEGEGGGTRLLMSAINVGEVYYFLRKQGFPALAESWRESSLTLPLNDRSTHGRRYLARRIVERVVPISYADAFAAALSQKYECPLVTGDSEFRSVDRLELDWIGRE